VTQIRQDILLSENFDFGLFPEFGTKGLQSQHNLEEFFSYADFWSIYSFPTAFATDSHLEIVEHTKPLVARSVSKKIAIPKRPILCVKKKRDTHRYRANNVMNRARTKIPAIAKQRACKWSKKENQFDRSV